MEGRNEVFKTLKPVCVAVSQVALQHKAKKASSKQVVEALRSLLTVLQGLDDLDPKLADYVFFPLSFIFRDSKALPSKAVELSLQCLQILIARGWRGQTSVDLCKQLLMLLGYFADQEVTRRVNQDVDELTCLAAIHCLASLLQASGIAVSSFVESSETESLLAIGHIVTVILASLTESNSADIQLQAVQALHGLISCLSNKELLRNFLPGIVSGLTKVLQPSTQSRRSYRILAQSLEVLALMLQKTIGKQVVCEQPGNGSKREDNTNWLKATSGQLKLALANIAPLRYHDRIEVLEALLQLSMAVLDDCSETLGESATLMLETTICIYSHNAASGNEIKQLQAIQILLSVNPDLSDILKSIAFDWIGGLSRVLLSADDIKHKRLINQIATAIKILARLENNSSMLEDALASALQESTIAVMNFAQEYTIHTIRDKSQEVFTMLDTTMVSKTSLHFNPVPVAGNNQKNTLQEIYGLINQLGSTIPTSTLMRRLTNSLPGTDGNDHIACLWLSSKLFLDISNKATELDEFVQIPHEVDAATREFMEVTYSHCIDLLSAPDIQDGSDWRLQALALEIVAMQATHDGQSFRSELVDTLYPILERVGSPNALLRDHAMTCLNIVSQSCQYQSASDLIIQNADYLVNAIALKFNTFEISPQAPQVISMMIKLCGPPLIPYLDDLVDSIFAALASFHGYERLAESLFSVLQTIVEESSRSPLLGVEASTPNHRRPSRIPLTISDVAASLKPRQSHKERPLDLPQDLLSETHLTPQSPWTSISTASNPSNSDTAVDKPQTPTKTHTLTNSILTLTQHHLTTPSSALRLALLSLTSTGLSTLSHDSEVLLPLINSLWPVLLARLHDPEPFIVIAACETLSTIFRIAGEFVNSRVSDEWDDIKGLYRRVEERVRRENKGRGGRGGFGEARRVWEGWVGALVAVGEMVELEAEREDELVEMLAPLLEEGRENVRGCLEGLNADAVWLIEERYRLERGAEVLKAPVCNGFEFTEIRM